MSEKGESNLRIVPASVLDFFQSHSSRILLVKGHSGAGKSIFAVSALEDLLSTYFETKDFIYVTARTPSEFLPSLFKSYQPAILPTNVINLSESPESSKSGGLAAPQTDHALEEMLTGSIGKKRHSVVVFDTIEGVAERVKSSPAALVTMLNELNRRKDTKAIVVSDASGADSIDPLVDGVVVLSMADEGDIVWRKIHLSKLRGVPVGRGTYYFTLKGSRFSTLWPADADAMRKMQPFKVKAHTTSRFFSGLAGLDEILGGFRLGSTVFVAVGPNVDNEVVNTIVLITAANFMSQNGGVLIVPPNRLSYRSVKSAALRLNFFDHLNSSLRLLTYQFAASPPSSETGGATEPYWKPIRTTDSNKLDEEMDKALLELRANGCSDTLIVFGFGLLRAWFGPQDLDRWAMRASTSSAESSGLALLVGYNSTADINPVLSDVADVHLSLTVRAGLTLLKGMRPDTPYYSVYTCESHGGTHIGFQEVS